jgi:NTP pyrophosphatase (non-canonical NTP hydrolase)
MKDQTTTIAELKLKIKKFISDRNWEQYHDPKNLSMSIAIEAAELMENFQWGDRNASVELFSNRKLRENIEDEIADIAIYLLDFCGMNNMDLTEIIERKLHKNRKKYPIRLSKGKSTKYNQLKKKS